MSYRSHGHVLVETSAGRLQTWSMLRSCMRIYTLTPKTGHVKKREKSCITEQKSIQKGQREAAQRERTQHWPAFFNAEGAHLHFYSPTWKWTTTPSFSWKRKERLKVKAPSLTARRWLPPPLLLFCRVLCFDLFTFSQTGFRQKLMFETFKQI